MPDDTAASDLIGVMALIAIFVTAAAIVGVALLSNPPGDAAPAMLAHMETEGGTVFIYHDGGDPLERGHFKILVNGEPDGGLQSRQCIREPIRRLDGVGDRAGPRPQQGRDSL